MKPTAEHYDIIQRPRITEKSTMASDHNTVVFETPIAATKPQIKEAAEALFSVKVKSVRTVVKKGKRVRFRGQPGKRKDTKTALIRLEKGYHIDTGSGL